MCAIDYGPYYRRKPLQYRKSLTTRRSPLLYDEIPNYRKKSGIWDGCTRL